VRLERRRVRRLLWGSQERGDDDLPWPLWTFAVVFGVFVLGTLAMWALIRAKLSALPVEEWNLSNYHLHSAILLMLLSVAAVAMRVISHNPYAISDKSAKERMAQVRAESETLRRKATDRLARHAQAWSRLQAALAAARSQAQRFVEAGRAQILELRAERVAEGKPAQDATIPLTMEVWPVDKDGEIAGGPQTVDLTGEFRLHYEVLDYAKELAERLTPQRLEQQLNEVDVDMGGQFAGG
jgi:hypothetical protein